MSVAHDSAGRPRTEPVNGYDSPSETGGEGSFLARWSRRKRGVDHGDLPVASPPTETPASDAGAEMTEAEQEEPSLPEDLAGLDPETVDPAELDYARLMREDVPESFRRRALRRLWEADETLVNLDGLNEYDEDFTGGGIKAAAAAFFRRVAEWEARLHETAGRPASGCGHENSGMAAESAREGTDRPVSTTAGTSPDTPASSAPAELPPESQT